MRGRNRTSLVGRALLAFLAMDAMAATYFGAGHSFGFARDSDIPSVYNAMFFGAVATAGYWAFAAFAVYLPASLLARASRVGWTPLAAVIAAIAFSPLTMGLIVVAGWVAGSSDRSFSEFAAGLFRGPWPLAFILPTYALGGIIVSSGLLRPPTARVN